MIALPPKRFQSDLDTCYDPIRHKSWFHKLGERRKKLHLLRCAYHDTTNLKIGLTQTEAADHWGIDRRELSDYSFFVEDHSRLFHSEPWHKESDAFQKILDEAYEAYCKDNATHHLRHYIERIAPLWGKKARHVVEFWEVDPLFYPSSWEYKHEKISNGAGDPTS